MVLPGTWAKRAGMTTTGTTSAQPAHGQRRDARARRSRLRARVLALVDSTSRTNGTGHTVGLARKAGYPVDRRVGGEAVKVAEVTWRSARIRATGRLASSSTPTARTALARRSPGTSGAPNPQPNRRRAVLTALERLQKNRQQAVVYTNLKAAVPSADYRPWPGAEGFQALVGRIHRASVESGCEVAWCSSGHPRMAAALRGRPRRKRGGPMSAAPELAP